MEISSTKFDKEFIDRTYALILQYDGDKEFTLLINCLLGLIIFPIERYKKLNLDFLDHNLSDINAINSCIINSNNFVFNPTHYDLKSKQFVCSKKSLYIFFTKIRNCLAHFGSVEPINENGKWKGITIIDINKNNNNNIELSLTLKYNEVRIIAEYIKSEYNKCI
jgi:hypothetical protein